MTKLFSQYKFFFYLLNFILIFLYLSPASIVKIFFYNDIYFYSQIESDFKISANHIYVFLIFSLIGFLTYPKFNHFIFLSIYLIFLSIILELMHLLVPYRAFEFADLFGNIIGTSITLIVIFIYRKHVSKKINYNFLK